MQTKAAVGGGTMTCSTRMALWTRTTTAPSQINIIKSRWLTLGLTKFIAMPTRSWIMLPCRRWCTLRMPTAWSKSPRSCRNAGDVHGVCCRSRVRTTAPQGSKKRN